MALTVDVITKEKEREGRVPLVQVVAASSERSSDERDRQRERETFVRKRK